MEKRNTKPYETISTVGMTRNSWLEQRKLGIGGSEAGAILGVNPWCSAMDVYLDKISDDVVEETNLAMELGTELEDFLAKKFMEAEGTKVCKSRKIYKSVEHPFMLANVDRLGWKHGKMFGLEIKTVNPRSAHLWADNHIPEHYVAQVDHYRAVLGIEDFYIIALIYGEGIIIREVDYNPDRIERLIQEEKKFFTENVLKRVCPIPDGSKANGEAIRRLYPNATKEDVIVLDNVDDKLDRWAWLTKEIAKLETEKTKISQEVQLMMGTCSHASSSSYQISFDNVTRTSLDVKRLKKELPQVYDAYVTNNTSRRFTVKAA